MAARLRNPAPHTRRHAKTHSTLIAFPSLAERAWSATKMNFRMNISQNNMATPAQGMAQWPGKDL
ncbi:hypothetical protein [Chromobacterium phragmitis]|uniref:Uncharacterized protein n=1 Tax=Chromobacterium phragmitis TaxID=2202141 RepID=A0ABV0IMJ9_9NEIS